MTSPCMHCAERAPGCHGRCERYQAYRATRDRALKNRDRENAVTEVSVMCIRREKKKIGQSKRR